MRCKRDARFRGAENSSGTVTGQVIRIVHTETASGPTAHKLPKNQDGMSFGQHVREDDQCTTTS
jgi:hypothetical protein